MRFTEKIRQTLKKQSRTNKFFNIIIYRTLKNLYILFRKTIRILIDSEFRSIVLLKIFRKQSFHQTTTSTILDRYPEVFYSCCGYFENKAKLKILSFGCSTGEEVITLRKYFKEATIIGAEINKSCLKICLKRNLDDKIKFIHSTTKGIKENGPYDAIFCMAVMQRTPHYIRDANIKYLKDRYPFYKFDEQLVILDQFLNKDGLFIVHYTQYQFDESTIACRYKPYDNVTQMYYNFPVFNKDGYINENLEPQKTVHIKLQDSK